MPTAYAWLAIVSVLILVMVIWDKRVNKIWLLILGTAPVVIAYIANPVLRLRSYHSLLHAGIAYQVLNANIPPSAPLVGGYPLKYPWGAHLLVAGISKTFNVTPFTSFALVNTVALILAVLLVYRISKLVIDDEMANILSVIVAIYGITLLPYPVLKFIEVKVAAEPRGIPVFSKFTNVNALPLGLSFVLLSLDSVIRLIRRQRVILSAILMLISTVGCGFFYFPFLPGLIVGIIAACVLILLLRKTDSPARDTKLIALTMIILLVGVLILAPYLMLIAGKVRTQIEISGLERILAKLWKSLIACGPIAVIILLTARRLRGQLRGQDLVLLVSFVGANLVCYVLAHMPTGAEYKFLVLSTVTLGIVGGIAFRLLSRQTSRVVVSLLLILFIMPSFRSIARKVTPWEAREPSYFEQGMNLRIAERVEDALYTWIRTNTSRQAIFIDTELEIPALAQRQLFVPAADLEKRRHGRGLASLREILELQCGNDLEVIERRREIIGNIYGRSSAITSTDLEYLHDLPGPVYIVARSSALREKFDQAFEQVLAVGRAGPAIYALRQPSSDAP